MPKKSNIYSDKTHNPDGTLKLRGRGRGLGKNAPKGNRNSDRPSVKRKTRTLSKPIKGSFLKKIELRNKKLKKATDKAAGKK